MAGIFYGAQYGGSITAILVRIPGEASSVVTCLDGYAMARQGRAGAALGIAAFGSFIAGVLVTAALFVVGPVLADFALAFGPAEYTALVLLGLLLVTQLSSGSQIDALLMVASASAVDRRQGPDLRHRALYLSHLQLVRRAQHRAPRHGVFGVAELLVMAEGGSAAARPVAQPKRLIELLPQPRRLARECAADPARNGTRILPRAAARRRRHLVVVHILCAGAAAGEIAGAVRPRRHRGRRRAESANNAAAQSSFVPLLSLGIPANAVMGVILGALLIQGITPGPRSSPIVPTSSSA